MLNKIIEISFKDKPVLGTDRPDEIDLQLFIDQIIYHNRVKNDPSASTENIRRVARIMRIEIFDV